MKWVFLMKCLFCLLFHFLICVIFLLRFSWVLLKTEVAHCILSFWLMYVILTKYIFHKFLWSYFFYQCKYWNQSNTTWAHTQLDFPLGYINCVVKYKANYFDWKITKKKFKVTKLMTEVSSFISKLMLI